MFFFPPFKRIELFFYDYRINSFGNQSNLDPRIVIAGIDEPSLAKLGQMPWPRNIHGNLVRNLTLAGADVIAFDVLFTTHDRMSGLNDNEFAKALKESGKVFLASKAEFSKSGLGEIVVSNPIKILYNSAKGTGTINFNADIDEIYRKAILFIDINGRKIPSLDLLTACYALGLKPEDIIYEKDRVLLGSAVIPVVDGNRMLINYLREGVRTEGESTTVITPVSYYKFLNPDEPKKVRNKIILVGAAARGLDDIAKTPVGDRYGVVVHSNVLNTILQGKYIMKAGWGFDDAAVFIVALIIGLILPKFNTIKGSIITVFVIAFYLVLNIFFFSRGIWIALAAPLLAGVFTFTGVAVYQFLRTRGLFGQFVSPELVDEMLKFEEKQKLGGEEKEVSVLFSDIRGYTNLSEKMSPAEVMKLLNEYHSKMSRIFIENDGRVFDYQGDAQMVVFGAVKERKDHALAAVKSALQMQEALEEMRKEWKIERKELFEIGVGICTGMVALGLVGAEEHKQLAAIGDSTNVAARLQGLSRELESPVLISESTYQPAKEYIITDKLEPVRLKGKSEPLQVYRVKGLKN
ncbi:MAG: adenylate/guanylate cyclase domain-containing protein [Firmicutes bacterium]|nr:adenylate/guanylate cyclase domain-containing protein [Bacillota bacterium]